MSTRLAASEAAVVELIARSRVIAVTTIDDVAQAEAIGRALLAGGLTCIEIALRSKAALEGIERAGTVDGLLVGAGTVLSPEQAETARAAGAAFAVAPGMNEAVVAACRDLELPFFPGVATPSEIERARELGLRVLKLFPAEQLGGPRFVQAVTPTYPDVRFLPTGGLSPANMRDYLTLPSVLAVGGSWLVKPEFLRGGRFDEVERLAREAVELAA